MKISSFGKVLNLLPNGHLRLYDVNVDTAPMRAGLMTTMVLAGGSTQVNGGMNMKGREPDIRMWDATCKFPHGGMKLGIDPVKSGEVSQMEMAQQGKIQMPWVLFTGNEDAICLAWTAVVWPDNSLYVWSGDWARACRRHWYYSDTFLQGTDRKPACQWIDKNYDTVETGFSLHWPSFTMDREFVPTQKVHIDRLKDHICHGGAYMSHKEYDPHAVSCDPNFAMPDLYNDTLWFPDGRRNEAVGDPPPIRRRSSSSSSSSSSQKKPTTARERRLRRSSSRQNNPHDSALVVTDDPTHSAEELCGHPESRGPNLVNVHEGRYCHMIDKSLWPVCSLRNTTSNCFDKDAQMLLVEGLGLGKRGIQYDNVLDWTGNLNATAPRAR